MYNQTISTTTYEYDGSGLLLQTNTETTYNYFNLIILLLLPLTTWIVMRFFKKQK